MRVKVSVIAVVVCAFGLTAAAQSWVNVQSMTAPRHSHAAVTGPDGKIYVIGGQRFGQCLDTAEQYNAFTNTPWSQVPDSMAVARCQPGAVTGADGYIYVIGGWTGAAATAEVERFDTATKTWKKLNPLNDARIRPAVAVGPDLRIYALGGTDTNGQPVTTVEMFDGTDWKYVNTSAPGARIGVTGSDGNIYTYGLGAGAQRGRFDGTNWLPQGALQPESNVDYDGTTGPDGLMYMMGIGGLYKLGSSLVAGYDANGSVFNVPGMLRMRNYAGGAAAAEGRLYITGGTQFQGSVELKATETYGPVYAPVLPETTAWFRFDEQSGSAVLDSYGSSSAKAINSPARTGGRVGRSIVMNGLSRYVRVEDGPGVEFGDGDMTIEAWIRWIHPTNINQVITLIDKRDYMNGYRGYSVYFYKGRLGVQLANGTTYVNYGATRKIPSGEWTHIAITVDRSAKLMSAYVNGVLDTTWVPLAGNTDNDAPLLIARHSFSPDTFRWVHGVVDELTFYNRALRWAEVRGIFLAGREGKEFF